MFGELTKIKLSGKEYPICCNFVVLEYLQEKYGTISKAEEQIMTYEPKKDENGKIIKTVIDGEERVSYVSKFPKVKAINDFLYKMANEAAEIEGKEKPFKDVKDAARVIDISIFEIAETLHAEFLKCFETKNA